nr:Golgi apparatus membrane protein TVP23 homolog B-like isoform X1 [Hydra vulgaris]
MNVRESEDIGLSFGNDDNEVKKTKFKHPYASFFHLFFRTSALIFYFIFNFITSSFITGFVVIVLMLSIDFWVVKNVTGRLLVGLRWWNYIDEDGNSQWIFEARKKKKKGELSKTIPTESRLFWLGLLIFPIFWAFLLIVALASLKLQSILIVLVAIILTSANLIGYVKCKKDAGKDMKSMAGSFLGRQILNQISLNTDAPK